ncbi:MAG: ATP-dependent acyl-CoA ligase [Rhodospirillales bacterium]
MPAEVCVLRYALEKQARSRGDAIFAAFEEGERWTYDETLARVRALAAGLEAQGIGKGDRVLILLPNGPFGLLALFAVNYLGAVSVPVNPAYRGALLAHAIVDSGAVLAILHPEVLERVLAAPRGSLKTLLVAGEGGGIQQTVPDLEILDHGRLMAAAGALRPPTEPIDPWDLQSVIYTSGTTGRSKGVLSSYLHAYTAMNPDTWTCTRRDDRHLLHMPLFHIGGAFIASMAACVGASIAVVERFRTEQFWEQVRALEVTTVFLLGAMATFLLKQPPRADDRDHPLRSVIIVPLGGSGPAFKARFGVDVFTLFNMTEISTPLISAANPEKAGVCGRRRPGVALRLVDANDCPVPDGSVGELAIRTAAPWTLSHGYNNRPDATAAAWRNGWFHTGDLFIRDGDGDYFFYDRAKDAIRRRGENISSYEVEVELLAHPDVREAAAVGVPSDETEEEVLAVLAPLPGRTLDPVDLLAFLRPRLAPFMLPRFIRIVGELPKTPTEKVEKRLLREAGVTAETWDREAAGVKVTGERLSRL